ncbi:MAG: alpha/beta hydrolase [Bryobacteraceae bacterium]
MLLELIFFIIGLFALLLTAGILYQQQGLRQDRRKYPYPGRLVALGRHRLHIYELGSGAPAVVFESGLASSSLSWNPVQRLVAHGARTISYERAGIGWSEESAAPRTLANMIDDLQALLKNSGNPPPYILVGHSFGALLARAYASIRSEEVAGLVLVDPVSLKFWADCTPQDDRRLGLGAKLARRGVVLANIGVVRLALAALASGRTRLPKAVARASAGKAVGALGRMTGVVQKLPASLRPAVQSHWSQAKSFRALAEYLRILRDCAGEARVMPLPSRIPLTILSGADATREELAERETWAHASIRGRHLQVAESSHWIQLDQPEQVAAAVLELIGYSRELSSV